MPAAKKYFISSASNMRLPLNYNQLVWDDAESLVEEMVDYSVKAYASLGTTATYKMYPKPSAIGSFDLHIVNSQYPNGQVFYASLSPTPTTRCPEGYILSNFDPDKCNGPPCEAGKVYDAEKGCIPKPPLKRCRLNKDGKCEDKNKKPTCDERTANPINLATGNKFLVEQDSFARGNGGLGFVRYYHSQTNGEQRGMGYGWRHNFDHFISVDPDYAVRSVIMNRADGSAHRFEFNGTSFVRSNGFINDLLSELIDTNGTTFGWRYQVADDNSIETYNAQGSLISITRPYGSSLNFKYKTLENGLVRLSLVTSVPSLRFTYDTDGQLISTRHGANQYSYQYDSMNNLVKVTYPDGKYKGYLYNEPEYTSGASLPNALTGIIDENLNRYATYQYDLNGRAVSEFNGGGANQLSINYGVNGQTSVTDSLNNTTTIHFSSFDGNLKNLGRSQPAGAGCNAAASAVERDVHGNVLALTNFNGVTTRYTYDLTRNLEVNRVEGYGTSDARKISTIWHASFRAPVQIDEPQLRTTYEYDIDMRIIKRTIQSTSDLTGMQGSSATPIGLARSWNFTYNSAGQVKTVVGPMIGNVIQMAYNENFDGTLYKLTNALGHEVTYSDTNDYGQPKLITDPNGVTTALTYHPRGWLLSRAVTADGVTETTSYTYDGVGQMTQVTLPDNSVITYTYDDAHRLTKVSDHLGNSITYTLDNMGNRVKEEVKDASGTLTQQVTRVYDVLNRLKEVTGGMQ